MAAMHADTTPDPGLEVPPDTAPVVVSRCDRSTVCAFGDELLEVRPPSLEVVDALKRARPVDRTATRSALRPTTRSIGIT